MLCRVVGASGCRVRRESIDGGGGYYLVQGLAGENWYPLCYVPEPAPMDGGQRGVDLAAG